MGAIQEIRCPSCHGSWKIRAGHGRRHGRLDQVLKAFPEDMQKKILADAGRNREPLFLFNYRMAACPQCRNIVAVPFLRFLETGWTYVSPCPQCSGTAEVLEEDLPISCPRCQKEGMAVLEIGNWD